MSVQPLVDRAEDAYRRYREGRGRLDAAYHAVLELLEELEQLRLQNPHGVTDVVLLGHLDPRELAAVLAYGQGLNREAFEHLERARGRALLDRTLNRLPVAATTVGPGLLQDEIEASRRVIELTRLRESARAQRRPVDRELEASLAAARAILLNAQAAIRQQDPAYAAVRGVTPAALADVQALLDDRTALVAYGPTSERLLVFIVRSDGFWAEHVDVARTEITAQISRFRDLVDRVTTRPRDIVLDADPQLDTGSAARIDEHAYDEVARGLHQLLIEPALYHLRGIDRLCVIPHDDLQLIPFQALRGDGGYLIERFAVWYAPSISLLDLCYQRQRQSRGRLLALGNPDLGPQRALPFAEGEALAIGSMMHGCVLIRDRATLAALNSELDRVDLLHVACHAEWNAGQPEFSALLLTPGPADSGRLEVQDLFRLERELPLSLVTLSACQTSLTAGSGLTGLTAGFLYAGAASVVASLWNVADLSTSELMIAFYRNLADLDRASALRAAQLALLHSANHAAPYHWAGFILIGSPARIDSERTTMTSAFHFVQLWTFRSTAGRLACPVADGHAIYATCLPPTMEELAAPVAADVMAICQQDRRLIWRRRLDSSARPLCAAPGLVHVNAAAKVTALRASDGVPVWELTTGTPLSQELIFASGVLYCGGKAGVVRAVAPETGEIIWTHELPRRGSGGFTCGEGRVLVGCADHRIYAIDARTGALQWTCDLGFATWSSGPAWISHGRLISEVGTFELATGKREIDTRIGDVVLHQGRPPTTAAGPVPPGVEASFHGVHVRSDVDLTFVSASYPRDPPGLTLFDTQSGALLRSFSLGSRLVSGIARTGDIVVVGDGDGHLHGFTIKRFTRDRERAA